MVRGNSFYLALELYPRSTLSDALCKLSDDGKSYIGPSDANPQSPWMWAFELPLLPAIQRLLVKHGMEFIMVES